MNIKKWDTHDFPVVEETATVGECLHRMEQYQTSECVVKDSEGHLKGVVNKEELIDLEMDSPISVRISLPEFFIHENDSITHALLLFLEHQEPYLPVVDEDLKVVGAVSLHDFLEALMETLAMDVPGIRFSVILEDKPGELKKVVDALFNSKINILSILTAREVDGRREVFVKVDTEDEKLLRELLKVVGVEIESMEREEGF